MEFIKKHSSPIDIIFITSLALVLLIVFGIIPRSAAFLILALYLGFILLKPLNQVQHLANNNFSNFSQMVFYKKQLVKKITHTLGQFSYS